MDLAQIVIAQTSPRNQFRYDRDACERSEKRKQNALATIAKARRVLATNVTAMRAGLSGLARRRMAG